MLVVTGVLMLVVAVVGDYGACNRSKSALGLVMSYPFQLKKQLALKMLENH